MSFKNEYNPLKSKCQDTPFMKNPRSTRAQTKFTASHPLSVYKALQCSLVPVLCSRSGVSG